MSDAQVQVAAEQAAQPAIRIIGDLQRINPRPGDVFVLKLEQHMPMDSFDLIRQALSANLPAGTKVIVLEKGMSLECVSAQQADLELAKFAKKAAA